MCIVDINFLLVRPIKNLFELQLQLEYRRYKKLVVKKTLGMYSDIQPTCLKSTHYKQVNMALNFRWKFHAETQYRFPN